MRHRPRSKPTILVEFVDSLSLIELPVTRINSNVLARLNQTLAVGIVDAIQNPITNALCTKVVVQANRPTSLMITCYGHAPDVAGNSLIPANPLRNAKMHRIDTLINVGELTSPTVLVHATNVKRSGII